MKMVAPGPRGSPRTYHTTISTTQVKPIVIAIGSMVAIIEPRPDFLSYFSAVMMINGINGSSGEMELVTESAIRNAACVNAGEKFIFMNIGTKIGAISAHFADALPITKLISIVIPINAKMRGIPVKLVLLKNSEPFTDRYNPRLDCENAFTN